MQRSITHVLKSSTSRAIVSLCESEIEAFPLTIIGNTQDFFFLLYWDSDLLLSLEVSVAPK